MIAGEQTEAREVPELRPFLERYGDFAGHALALGRRRGKHNAEDRRAINDSAAARFRVALETRNYGAAEAGYRLSLDLGTSSIPPLPPEE